MIYAGYIYLITNTSNGKVYVGQTRRDLESRFTEHVKALRSGTHFNTHLQRAFDKYGEPSFVFEKLHELPVDGLNTAEEREILERGCTDPSKGYNKKSGGDCAALTEETKQKIRDSLRMFHRDIGYGKETRSKMHVSAKSRWVGSRRLPEDAVSFIYTNDRLTHRELAELYGVSVGLVREVRYGSIYTDITCILPPNAWSDEYRAFRVGRSVVQSELDGRYVQTWNNPAEAETSGGFVRVSVLRCCKGYARSHRGYRWRYYSEDDRELSALGITGKCPTDEDAVNGAAA